MKNNNHKGFAILPLLFIIVAVAVAAGIGYAISTQTDLFLSKSENTNIVACTQEAKLCPDGSSVGRTGSNCAFADCPTTNTNVAANTNTNTAVNTNTTVSPTADWKTYENTTIGYTVKYPPTWKVSVCEGSTAVYFGLQGLKCDSESPSEDFGIAEIIDSISVSSRVASLKDAMVSPIESQVTVAGIQGTRIAGVHKKDLNTLRGGGQYSDDIFFMRNGKTYRLGYFILGGEKKYVSEFDGFYKTFTFTDPIAGWKTYTNETYNYSIKYPNEYTPSGTAANYRFDKGEPNVSGFNNIIISVITKKDVNVPENQDLYTWGKQGFPTNATIAGTHQNPRKETLGMLTFLVTDGDLASSGIPEYFLFHNDILYLLTSYSGDSSQASNRQLISTFTFTK